MQFSNYLIPGSLGKTIAIDLISNSDDDSPMVIFAHGFKGFKDWGTHDLTATYFAEQGLRFLKFNFSHNGISTKQKDFFDDLEGFSDNTFSRELYDLDQVITFALSGKEFNAPPAVYLIGHSLGGGICIVHTANDPRVKKLVTWASVERFNNLWSREQEELWRKNGITYFVNSRTNQQMPIKAGLLEDLEFNAEKLNIEEAAKRITQPWLIVHGDADTTVPLTQAEKLKKYQERAELLIIRNGDHVFGGKHPWENAILPQQLKKVCDASIAFFKE